ncbi:uncharacterized protein CG43867-like [Artemia franciscana]|uniref:uncharacterized protein CG43867-like n=1 Tax=Artemia franciscana TaxID=6661 RepID=UPI0032DB96DE
MERVRQSSSRNHSGDSIAEGRVRQQPIQGNMMDVRLSQLFDPILQMNSSRPELYAYDYSSANQSYGYCEPPDPRTVEYYSSSPYQSLQVPLHKPLSVHSPNSSIHSVLSDLGGEAETLDDSYHLENQEHNSYRLLHEEDDTNQDSYAWYQPTIHYVSGGPPNSFEDDRFTITARDNSVSPTEIDWRKRCVELEDSLRNFRDQAGSIRELLKNKLSELEARVVEAESRAEHAEDKVRIMERRFCDSSWPHSGESSGGDYVSLQHTMLEKDREISSLEIQVEEQRRLRLQEAKQVEAKAAKIKEWVTNKLRDLEEQNHHLREQNQKCNEQLELLKRKLLQISQLNGTSKNRASTEDSSRGSLDGDQQTSDDSTALDVIALSTRLAETAIADLGLGSDSLYAEVDPTKKRPKTTGLGLSGRVNSLMSQRFPENRLSAGNKSARDSRVDSGSADVETPLSLSPKSPTDGSDSLVSSEDFLKKPVPPPRTKVPKTPQLARKPQSANTLSGVSDDIIEDDNSLGSPLGELGRVIDSVISNIVNKDQDYDIPPTPRVCPAVKRTMTNETHDYAEIYTPSKEKNPDFGEVKPPTPPLHRCPSWESRIYQTANEGFSLPSGLNVCEIPTSQRTSRVSVLGGYKDINVPVYATVKGRASQIRSMPFTGDSSDSSDGEEHPELKTDEPMESGNDYALPPDAGEAAVGSESCVALVAKVTPTHSSNSNDSGRGDSLEKEGYLTKLGGKLKSWRKRWFVLRNGVLNYWKSQHDTNRKPQGQIKLDENCRILRADGASTFEIDSGSKVHYFTADSSTTMEDWVKVLQNVVRRHTTKLLLSAEGAKPTLQGWIIKVKQGHSKRCWCLLIGKTFIYFKSPNDQTPQGQINMREAKVAEVESLSDSDSDGTENGGEKSEFTIGIFPLQQDPTYLLLPSKQEKDTWLYNLTVVSGANSHEGTQFEQLIQRLMEVDGDPTSMVWKHPLLLFSKDPISNPLSTLPSDSLNYEAIKLFKAIQLYTSVLLDSAGIDYHVVLAQNALQVGLQIPDLQTELLSILIKQTSRVLILPGGASNPRSGVQVQSKNTLHKIKHSRQFLLCATQSLFACEAQKGSPTSSTNTASSNPGVFTPTQTNLIGAPPEKSTPPAHVILQGWQLLALAVSLFVPKSHKLLWFLRVHLRRNAEPKTEIGKYASYCQRALERALLKGSREAKPSRMEVLSILLKNPYHHSLPHAMPVHFPDKSYQVVGFDGSTTVEEFLVAVNQEIGCRDSSQSGFALFSDDPLEKDVDHWLEPQAKLCDVISKWETALREKGMGKFENSKVIRLTYKNRLYWKQATKNEGEKERLLLCYQVAEQISGNRFPLNKDLATELAAIMAQIDFGDLNPEKNRGSGGSSGSSSTISQVVERFIPSRYKEGSSPEEQKQIADSICDKWQALSGRSTHDCVRIFLTCTRKWPFFGASIYPAQVKLGGPFTDLDGISAWMAVCEDGLTLLETGAMQPLVRISYESVVTFGGCQEDFMVVLSTEEGPAGTQKMLFALPKPRILDITLLIADYMNALGCVVPTTPQGATLVRGESRRSHHIKSRASSHRFAGHEHDVKGTPEMESKFPHGSDGSR